VSVYLDWAATAPPDPEILELSSKAALEFPGNPSSAHPAGLAARVALEGARERVARALGVAAGSVIFTSGGTESNHLPMLSLLQRPARGSIALSAIEHPSVSELAKSLAAAGWRVHSIPCDRDGIVSPEAVVSALHEDTALVCVMAVNNETGAIQPVAEIARALRSATGPGTGRRPAHFHVDAVQAVGKVLIDLKADGIDTASASAHKIAGPRGIGILVANRAFEPFVRGGGQEGGTRPGTENLAGAMALALALERARLDHSRLDRARGLMARIVSGLRSIPGVTTIPASRGETDPRFSPWILQAATANVPGEVLVRVLGERGIFVSTGSACSSKKKSRPVLEAMGVSAETRQNAFRVSIGPTTSDGDVDAFLAELDRATRNY